jgi:hypothetical protein
VTRYGYYDTEAQPKAPIDELTTGGALVTTQDPDDYERPAAGDDEGRHKKAAAKV